MRTTPSSAAPKLRLLRGTGRMQWASTSLETVRHDGLELGVEKCPPTSAWAGQWEAFLRVRMPTEANHFRTARGYAPGMFSGPDAAMDAAERHAARLGDVRAVLAFLEAAPVLARLWWGRR